MSRPRLLPALVGVLALAACTSDVPTLPSSTEASAARAATPAASERYLVAANGGGFGADFADRVAALGGTVESIHRGAGIAVVSGVSSANLSKLARLSGVSDVQADVMIQVLPSARAVRADASSVDASSVDASSVDAQSVANPAAAILFSWQWNMRLIRANAAWAAGKLGSEGVTVAILDSGIDYNNLDLNGLVDLSRSASFVASDDSITAKFFPSRNKITDYNGHGTNVAQQVSSKAVAFAGVTSKTTLIGVKVLGRTGSGPLSSVLNGVLWAADHGADVANMSLGGDFPKAGNGAAVSLINRVFNYANSKGMLIVVAAGNAATDIDHNGNIQNDYCDLPHVICVSAVGPEVATDDPDMPAWYSNFGRSAISVAAPGGSFTDLNNPAVSVWPWGADIASWVFSLCSRTLISGFAENGTPITPCASGNFVLSAIGTSQASPHVAGLAALLIAEQGQSTPSQIKAAILKSAVDLGQPGTDPFYGRGRIDVANALGL
jgi:lantibiotic leader peptide-processing serine protease